LYGVMRLIGNSIDRDFTHIVFLINIFNHYSNDKFSDKTDEKSIAEHVPFYQIVDSIRGALLNKLENEKWNEAFKKNDYETPNYVYVLDILKKKD
jgi:hypothetical protein